MITGDDIRIVAPPDGPAEGEVVHPLACFHRKWKVDEPRARTEYQDAVRALEASFTDEQRALYFAVEVTGDWYKIASADRIVSELCRHFPLLSPVIRAVAYHIEDEIQEDPQGACCRGVRVHIGPGSEHAELE
jgi:hypothetical protein